MKQYKIILQNGNTVLITSNTPILMSGTNQMYFYNEQGEIVAIAPATAFIKLMD